MTQEADLKELGQALHRRLLTKQDGRVTAEIAEVFLPLLANALHRKFPNLPDPHQAETVAIDSLLRYFAQPEKFDPDKGSLIGYLYLAAYRDLLNLLKHSQKFVELHPRALEHEVSVAVGADNPEAHLLEEASPIVQRALAKVTDPIDRELVALMMDGVRETAAYAAVLGIADSPLREQEKIVKRHKDRLKKMLQREWQRRDHQRR